MQVNSQLNLVTNVTMYRYSKYILSILCFVVLCVIVYRYSRLREGVLPSKMKVYSFTLDSNEVVIHQDGRQVDHVKWTKDSTKSNKETYVINIQPTDKITDKPSQLTKEDATVKVTSKQSISKTSSPKPTSSSSKPTLKVTTKPTTGKKDTVTTKTITLPQEVPGDGSQCSVEGERLVGALAVDQTVPKTEADIDKNWHEKGWVLKGGAWRPTKCQAVSKVAIIIPYRNREQQLKIFLRHMHPMLKRQLLDYRIMVIEQAGDTPFNRAMLFNIGYKEALKFHDFQCFVFHDVDLIPENDRNYYGCPSAPRHLSVAIDKFNYRLPYKSIFGGAGSFRKEDFVKINGFSNQFWGWGGEDDDLYRRITAKGFKLTRPSMKVGRYKMVRIFHKSAKADPLRFQKLRDSHKRMVRDGLTSLKYTIQETLENPLYTKVTVEVNPEDV